MFIIEDGHYINITGCAMKMIEAPPTMTIRVQRSLLNSTVKKTPSVVR
jgi:hypothetical protein